MLSKLIDICARNRFMVFTSVLLMTLAGIWSLRRVPLDALPARYPVLTGVQKFELQYLDAGRKWVLAWPTTPGDAAIPRAVRVRIVLVSGESIVRVFALNS